MSLDVCTYVDLTFTLLILSFFRRLVNLIFGMQMRPFMRNHPEAFGRTAQTERKQHMTTLDL